MKNNSQTPFFNSWKVVALFILVLLFQPANIALLGFRFSDVVLILGLIVQGRNFDILSTNYKEYKFLYYYGIVMGSLSFIATFVEYIYLDSAIQTQIFAHFYRWFRFTLILILLDNLELKEIDYKKIIQFLLVVLVIFLPISFFEFYDLYNFKVIIAGLYFPSFSGDLGGKEFNIGADQYISAFENEAFTYRALGFTGNANMTAIFYSICASIITVFLLNTKRWINIIFFSAILLACLALILTVFGSRTATLIVIINFILFALLNRKNRLQINTRILSIVFLIVTLISILLANDLIQDRVIGTIDEYAVSQDLVQTSGRSDFWDERFEDYYKYSNPVSLFIGLGYTKLFEDFADNGLLSSFMNRGLIGFTFHVIFILLILFQFRKVSRLTYYTYYPLIFYAILACCIFFEGTGDPSEHYKFGQFYFLFACLLFKSINDQKLLNKNQ